jgi:hypothetical protein
MAAPGSLGSLFAVVVALWMARRRRVGKPKLSIREIIQNSRGGSSEHIRFRVVNVGEAPVTITDIGWRVGFPWRRKVYILTPFVRSGESITSDPIPIEIKTNQPAVLWLFEPQSWWDFLAKQFHSGSAGLWVWSVRGWAETSDGRRISARLEKSLRVVLAQRARLSRKQI